MKKQKKIDGTLRYVRDLFVSDLIVVFFIVSNAVAVFLSPVFPESNFWYSVIERVDLFCVIYFIIEAILKINRDSWKNYIKSGWNRFDFFIVIFSIPVLFEPFLDIHNFEIFLVLRLGRLFRLFRIMQFIPNLNHLTVGIVRALKASVAVLLAIIIINVIFALGGTIFFGDIVPEYFGNPFISVYSTFKVFTVEGWYEIPDLIAENTNSNFMAAWARIYFISAVLIGGLLGLSLANAVFIDEMTADNNKLLEKKIDDLSNEIKALRSLIEEKKS